jgi:hypothetical protein
LTCGKRLEWPPGHFTPTSASWLNLVERFFAEITAKFEGLAMHMPVAVAARFLGIEDKRLWRVIFH